MFVWLLVPSTQRNFPPRYPQVSAEGRKSVSVTEICLCLLPSDLLRMMWVTTAGVVVPKRVGENAKC